MISIHLHGAGEHLAFLATVLLTLSAPVAAYFWGRTDGRDDADDGWREFLEYGELDDDLERHDAAFDAARLDAELRDRLDAIDDATTERVLNHLLTEAPDMNRSLLREASLIDQDAVADALRHEGAMP